MPSMMNKLDTMLTAAAMAEEGLPEFAMELLREADATEATTAQEERSQPPPSRQASR